MHSWMFSFDNRLDCERNPRKAPRRYCFNRFRRRLWGGSGARYAKPWQVKE